MQNKPYKKIAFLSGKGGTGKTTISTNLAYALGYDYVDLDVEEPNGYLFLKPDLIEEKMATILNPVIDSERCTRCGACKETCVFNALAMTLQDVLLFEELCHGCGACSLVCPEHAISEMPRPIGRIYLGDYERGRFISGSLNIKEPMAGPIISAIKEEPISNHTLYDCPPGTSCNVVKSLMDVDYAFVVTEETLFGLHDLEMVVTLLRDMSIPFSVIINKAQMQSPLIKTYLKDEGIDLTGEIIEAKLAASLYSQGKLLVSHKGFRAIFDDLAEKVKEVLDADRGA